MKLLLLLVMLALGALAVGVVGEGLEPKDFVVLKNESHPDDIDHNHVQKHEQSGASQRTRKKMPFHTAKMLKNQIDPKHMPHAFNVSLQKNTPLFDDNNGTNHLQTGSRSSRQFQTSLYHCEHSTYLLSWFPYFTDFDLHFCYIPWPSAHAITYAHCGMDCDIPYGRKGHCRPCCFHRRVVIALCINPQFYFNVWQWRVVELNLPQACLCTSCQQCG